MTYPHPEVARFISAQFVPVKVNILSGDAKQIAHLHNVWTPSFYVLDRDREQERRNGFMAPEEYSAWLRIALGDRALSRGRYDEAAAWFHEAGSEFAHSAFTPRSLYWEGVARYKQSGDHAALHGPWQELARRYPESSWGRAVAFAVAPQPV